MQSILNKEWDYLNSTNEQIMDCQLVRLYPGRGEKFLLEYQLVLQNGHAHKNQLILVELVGKDASKRRDKILCSLKKSRRGQLPKHQPANSVSSIPSLGLVVRLPGLDERITGLKLVYNRQTAMEAINASLDIGQEIAEVEDAILLGHRLGKRCIIRFKLRDKQPNSSIQSVIAKFYKANSERGLQVFKTMSRLRETGFDATSKIRIPRPMGFSREWNMLLMEDVNAAPVHQLADSDILKGIQQAGGALAKLHGCSLETSGNHTIDDELALLQRWIMLVSNIHTHLRSSVSMAFERVQKYLQQCQDYESKIAHRDFYEKQVLIDGHETVLIDFDTLCNADPALDVGNFLAHLRLIRLQGSKDFHGAELAFAAGYGNRGSSNFQHRCNAYLASSLLRLSCLYSFWPRWQFVVPELLKAIHAL